MEKKEDDLQQYERQLFSSQRIESLGILAGRMAHDLNNLLTVILGNIEILKYFPGLETNPPPEISQVSEAAKKAAELTRGMLVFCARGFGESEEIDVNALITESMPVLSAALPKNTPFSTELAGDLPFIFADRGQLQQILLNLVLNAGEALAAKSGKVIISTGRKEMSREELAGSVINAKPAAGSFVFFTVTDTGPGIDGAVIHRVFQPFFTTKADGRGLGLWAVEGIVREHHGALFLESVSGRQTRVSVMFPEPGAAGGSFQAPGTSAETGAGTGRFSGTFIVADDEPIVLRILTKILQSTGLSILPAKNGDEVLKLYREHAGKVDGLVLDVTMPGKSGIDCFYELKKMDAEVKVILASGAGEVKSMKALVDDGVFSYIPKPYTLEDLERDISRILAEKQKPA